MLSRHPVALMYLVTALVCSGLATKQDNTINILSVVEKSSIDMCLIKIQSIVISTKEPERITFGFLAMSRSDAQILQSRIFDCVPNITYEIKIYSEIKDPLVDRLEPVLKQLSSRGFEKPVIYARVILPDIFYDMQRFLYLDNDVVGNIDVVDIYDTPLVLGSNVSAHSGFVWERQTLNRMYLSHHLNYSHEVVQRVYENQTRAKNDFFNSGVWLCDAAMWRRLNNSNLVLDLIQRNVHENFCIRCSDQEFLFLAFSLSDTARLPIRFNYRRILKHSVDKLVYRRGFIHFAGSQKNDLYCWNLKHVHFRNSGAMHILLSSIYSLPNTCYAGFSTQFRQHCEDVLAVLKNDTNIPFTYSPIFEKLAEGL